eukprot:SAG11_NODE_399_length_9764_cov_8.760993_3_plen_240_part_00
MLFCIYCRYCSRGGTFPGTIAGGNYCWEHMDHHMNLEERVVAAEVASRRADGPGVIEVQSQRRSDVAGQGLGPGTQWRGRPVRLGSRGVHGCSTGNICKKAYRTFRPVPTNVQVNFSRNLGVADCIKLWRIDIRYLARRARCCTTLLRAATVLVPQSSVPQLGSTGVAGTLGHGTKIRYISFPDVHNLYSSLPEPKLLTMVRKFDISRFRRYRLGTARKSTFWVRNFAWRIALSCGGST